MNQQLVVYLPSNCFQCFTVNSTSVNSSPRSDTVINGKDNICGPQKSTNQTHISKPVSNVRLQHQRQSNYKTENPKMGPCAAHLPIHIKKTEYDASIDKQWNKKYLLFTKQTSKLYTD